MHEDISFWSVSIQVMLSPSGIDIPLGVLLDSKHPFKEQWMTDLYSCDLVGSAVNWSTFVSSHCALLSILPTFFLMILVECHRLVGSGGSRYGIRRFNVFFVSMLC